MSAAAELDRVIQTRGTHRGLDAFVVACAFDRGGQAAAFALGDGRAVLLPRGTEAWNEVAVHDGGALALAADAADGFLSGGDDGRFAHIAIRGEATTLATYGMKWVDTVTSFSDGKVRLRACSVGKQVHLFDGAGAAVKSLTHPSTVTGVAFDAKGKRVAASHYNGASLWFVASKSDNARKLEWKGSHTSIAVSPDGDSVVTAMQENALHGWRLSDGQHMRMSGYPAKTRGLGFTRSGKWLASSGAESIVIWPFFGGGPMGKTPTELAGGRDTLCTLVACHPQNEVVAAGYSDGLVVVADIVTSRILPVAAPGRGPVSALAWSPDGALLAFGTETGFAAVVDFTK